MSQVTINKSQALAAATAMSAVGFLTVPGMAQAEPMFPLAPACAKYEFDAPFQYTQDNEYVVQIPVTGDRAGPGKAMYLIPGRTLGTFGTPSGGIHGRTIDIRVNWEEGPGKGLSSNITGQINDDLFATGVAKNSQGVTNTWKSSFKQKCVPAAAPVPVQPPPLAPKTATVLMATNIFNLPDGEGTEYLDDDGQPIFKPPGAVQLVAPDLCRDNWCHVVAPEVDGPAWIFIGDGFGTYTP
jgi:hypothetical protein